jgi:hypothetical protein
MKRSTDRILTTHVGSPTQCACQRDAVDVFGRLASSYRADAGGG